MFHLDMAVAVSIAGGLGLRHRPRTAITKVELYFFEYVH
jgi:hypothetical protein